MASLRAGFSLGFLGGALLSSQLSGEGLNRELIDSSVEADAKTRARGLLDKLRARFQEAVAAGKEAAQEKEQELRSDYERSTNSKL